MRRFGRFLNENKFSAMLWLSVVVLLFASYQKSASQSTPTGGQRRPLSSGTFGKGKPCDLGNDADNDFANYAINCGLDLLFDDDDDVARRARQASSLRFEWNVGQADPNYPFLTHG